MAVPQSAKRISTLPAMTDQQIIALQDDKEKALEWAIGVDSLCRSNATGENYLPGVDLGSVYIQMSRIAMRDKNGKIPASMLPGHIDDIIFGKLTLTDSKASFEEVCPEGGTPHVYVSPESQRSSTELPPPENIIYCDTTTDLQYRYIVGQESTSPNYGFIEVPGSRAISPGYGIDVETTSGGNVTTVSAKKADFYTMYRNDSNPLAVNDTPSNLPLSTDYVEQSVLNASVENNRLTKVTGLIPDARYAINVQLDCTPNTLSANIINVSLTCGSVPAIARQMNMAGPDTTSVTKLDYFCEFKNGNDTELVIQLSAEEPITVKTTRFTIFELL